MRYLAILLCAMLAFSCRRTFPPGAEETMRSGETTRTDVGQVPFTKDIFGDDLRGLQTRVWAEKAEHFAGEPIEVVVEIRNNGESKATAQTDAHVIFKNGHFTVRDASGNLVRNIREGVSYFCEHRDLVPGQTDRLAKGDIARTFFLYRPGLYSIRFPHPHLLPNLLPDGTDRIFPSNLFLIRVLPPRTPNPLLEMLGRIIEGLPWEWEITVDGISSESFPEESRQCTGRFRLRTETEYDNRYPGPALVGRIDVSFGTAEGNGEFLCRIGGHDVRVWADDYAQQKWSTFKRDLVHSLSRGLLQYEEAPPRGIVFRIADPGSFAPGRPAVIRLAVENHGTQPCHAHCAPELTLISGGECVGRAKFALEADTRPPEDGRTDLFHLEPGSARTIAIDLFRLKYTMKDVKGKRDIVGGFFEGGLPNVFGVSVALNFRNPPDLPLRKPPLVYCGVVDEEPPPIGGLRLELVPDEEEFTHWGPIGFKARLVNASDHPVNVRRRFDFPYPFFVSVRPEARAAGEFDLDWQAGDYDGRLYTPMCLASGLEPSSVDWRHEAMTVIAPASLSDFVVLEPGAAIEHAFELDSIIRGELSRGLYTIRVFYRNFESGTWLDLNPPAAVGIVKSDPIRATVH